MNNIDNLDENKRVSQALIVAKYTTNNNGLTSDWNNIRKNLLPSFFQTYQPKYTFELYPHITTLKIKKTFKTDQSNGKKKGDNSVFQNNNRNNDIEMIKNIYISISKRFNKSIKINLNKLGLTTTNENHEIVLLNKRNLS